MKFYGGNKSVYEYFQLRESATVPQLAGHLGLPGSTVVGLVNRMVRGGLLYRSGARPGKRGRPTFAYRLRLPGPVGACEIEGTRISTAVFDQQLQTLALEQQSFPRPADAQDAHRLAEQLFLRALRKSGRQSSEILAIITSLNAVAIDDRAIASSVLPWAQNHAGNFNDLAGIPVHLVIGSAVLSEYRRLESPPSSLCLLRAGDGVSARIISNGKLLKGAHSIAGQLGHVIAQPDGLLCGCGRRGCLETYCSGPGIVRQVMQGLSEGANSELRGVDLAAICPAEALDIIHRAWRNGDSFARAVMDTVLDRLAWGLGIVVDLLDPDMIVAGGYVLKDRIEWIDEIHRRAQRWIVHSAKRAIHVTSASATVEDDLRTLASQLHWLTLVEETPSRRRRRTTGQS